MKRDEYKMTQQVDTTNYKEKYEQALERAKKGECIENIFPELRESEDEKIKRCIGMCLTDATEQRFEDFNTNLKDCLAWLEKQGGKSVCKVKIGETYKCIASPRYTCFRKGYIYHVKDNFVAELINTCSDCFVLLEKQDEQKLTDNAEPKFKVGD